MRTARSLTEGLGAVVSVPEAATKGVAEHLRGDLAGEVRIGRLALQGADVGQPLLDPGVVPGHRGRGVQRQGVDLAAGLGQAGGQFLEHLARPGGVGRQGRLQGAQALVGLGALLAQGLGRQLGRTIPSLTLMAAWGIVALPIIKVVGHLFGGIPMGGAAGGMLVVLASPVWDYFTTGPKALRIYVEEVDDASFFA